MDNVEIPVVVSYEQARLQQAVADTKNLAQATDSLNLSQKQVMELANASATARAGLIAKYQQEADAARQVENVTRQLAAAQHEAQTSASLFGEELAKSVGLGAALGGGVMIAVEAVGLLKEAVIGGIEQFVAFGHSLDLLHTKINVPLEAAAAWQQTESVTGISAERMANSIAMMDQRLEEGNKKAINAINDLGISMSALRDASPDQQVAMLSEAFAHLEESGHKADVVIRELMGRGGLSMLPALTPEAAAYRQQIEAIIGPLGQQVALAQKYELAAGLLAAHWERIKRAIAESGGVQLATSALRITGNFLSSGQTGDLGSGHGASVSWQSYGFGPGQTPVDTANVVATQAQIEADDRRVEQERERHQKALEKIDELINDSRMRAWHIFIKQEEENHKHEMKIGLDRLKWEEDAGKEEDRIIEANTRQFIADERKRVAEEKALEAEVKRAYDEDVRLANQSAHNWAQAFKAIQAASKAFAGETVADLFTLAAGFAGVEEAIQHRHAVMLEADKQRELGNDAAADEIETNYKIASAINAATTAIEIYTRAQHARTAADVEASTISGVAQGAQAGAAFGPYGAVAGGIIGGLIGFFSANDAKNKWEAAGRDIGDALGHGVSDKLHEQIDALAKELGVSEGTAALLSLDKAMAEGMSKGATASSFEPAIFRLLDGIHAKSIPAEQGITQLGKAFNLLKTSAEAGSQASEAAMIDMIRHARELGLAIPDMQKFILSSLTGSAANLDKFFAGQGVPGRHGAPAEWSPELGAANATILGANFSGLAAQEGVVKAAEHLQKAFDELIKHMPAGMALPKGLQHMATIEDLLHDDTFKKGAEASAAGAENMKALLDTANLNQETTDAFATSTEGLLKQSVQVGIDHGYSPDEARIAGEEANLPMLAELQHAQALGLKLSPEAALMLKQAQTDGILPMKTVAEQQLEELRAIHRLLGGNPTSGGGGGGGGGGESESGTVTTGTGRGRWHEMASGMDNVYTRPTRLPLLVGEAGAERVTIGPAGRGGGGITQNVQVTVPVDPSMLFHNREDFFAEVQSRLEDGIRRGNSPLVRALVDRGAVLR